MLPVNFEQVSVDVVQRDEIYQAQLLQCQKLEPAFLQIRQALPPSARDTLDLYIAAHEELLHRQAQLLATYYAKHHISL